MVLKYLLIFFIFARFIDSQSSPEHLTKRTSRNLGIFNNIFDGLFGLNNVYVPLYRSEGLSGSKGFYQDFFNNVSAFYTYEFNQQFNLTMKKLNEQYHLFNDNANYSIYSAKLYLQFANKLPRAEVQKEMAAAKGHPDHKPSLINYLIYDKFAKPVPEDQKVNIFHMLVEVCLTNDYDNSTHHFLVDRISKAEVPLKMWNSVVRLNYLGPGDGCALNSTQWADYRDGLCDAGNNVWVPCIWATANKTGMNVPMNKLLRVVEKFLLKYKVFNTLYNCDHFATDTYDLIANEHVDFVNWEIMGAHSPFSDKEPKIDFIDPQDLDEFS